MMARDFPKGANKFGYELDSLENKALVNKQEDWNIDEPGPMESPRGNSTPELNKPGHGVIDEQARKRMMLSCHGCSPEVEHEIWEFARKAGRPDAKIWSRCDLSSGTFRSSGTGGPCWSQVVAPVSARRLDQQVLECNMVEHILRCLEHGRIPFGKLT